MKINATSNVNFGTKIPTKKVVEALMPLPFQPNPKRSEEIFNTMLGVKEPLSVNAEAECVKNLRKQFPILVEIAKEAKSFFTKTKRSAEDANNWIKEQIKKIGTDELDIDLLKFGEK